MGSRLTNSRILSSLIMKFVALVSSSTSKSDVPTSTASAMFAACEVEPEAFGVEKSFVLRPPGSSPIMAEMGIHLRTERSERRPGVRQRVEIAISSLKRVFGVGETLATTLAGLATRIATKICAYTYAFLVNRMLSRPQGHIKELWA